MADTALTNIPELTVSELSTSLKRTIEDAYGHVRLRGEISGYKGPHSSGHVYFSLKDQSARIDAVIWKGIFSRLKIRPEEGMEVIATGKISTFPSSSRYQIIIESIEPAGIGALMALLEERRRKLAAEGLFDEARKQALPQLPQTIGVITSPTGAVIRDILHRLQDRFPRHVLLWPVRVQGETSADEVSKAIIGYNQFPIREIPKPNVLIVARGGGSLEDLWGFNEESVVRAVADSTIPVISAIGHETDWTLIDHAADMRAPTPTGAAELAVPVRHELIERIDDLKRRNRQAVFRNIKNTRRDLIQYQRLLPNAETILAQPQQKYDFLAQRLPVALSNNVKQHRLQFEKASHLLAPIALKQLIKYKKQTLRDISKTINTLKKSHLNKQNEHYLQTKRNFQQAKLQNIRTQNQKISHNKDRLKNLGNRLDNSIKIQCENRKKQLNSLSQILAAVSYQKTLQRGFVLVRDKLNKPIKQSAHLSANQTINLEFSDGNISAITLSGNKTDKEQIKAPVKKESSNITKQGQLF